MAFTLWIIPIQIKPYRMWYCQFNPISIGIVPNEMSLIGRCQLHAQRDSWNIAKIAFCWHFYGVNALCCISIRSIWTGVFTKKNVLFHPLISRPFDYLKFINYINSRMLQTKRQRRLRSFIFKCVLRITTTMVISASTCFRWCACFRSLPPTTCDTVKHIENWIWVWNKKLLLEPWN